MKAGKDANVLIVEGLHINPSHPFTSQLNVDIANSLKAEVIVVADGSEANAVTDLHLNICLLYTSRCV